MTKQLTSTSKCIFVLVKPGGSEPRNKGTSPGGGGGGRSHLGFAFLAGTKRALVTASRVFFIFDFRGLDIQIGDAREVHAIDLHLRFGPPTFFLHGDERSAKRARKDHRRKKSALRTRNINDHEPDFHSFPIIIVIRPRTPVFSDCTYDMQKLC